MGDPFEKELAKRELARKHLIDFCAYVDPESAHGRPGDPFWASRYRAPHLQLIGDTIEKAVDGSLWDGIPGHGKKILAISVPPGHWKSSLVSRKLPAWVIPVLKDRGDRYQIILTSYNSDLAESNSDKVLELIKSERYRRLFDIELSPKEQSKGKWSIKGDAFTTVRATGVGGGLTGYHAQIIIVDDPIKDETEATSKSARDKLWSWWDNVVNTRLHKGGFIVAMWTRWTDDDPLGRILADQKAGTNEDRLVVLRLPALAEDQKEREKAVEAGFPLELADPLGRDPGVALWPEEKESAAELMAIRKKSPWTFQSLYQGNPIPANGMMVGRDDFNILPTMPASNVKWVWGTDWAMTDKESGDYTAAALVGKWAHPDGDGVRLVIGFIGRAKKKPTEARAAVRDWVLSAEGYTRQIRGGQASLDQVYFGTLRQDPALLRYSIKNIKDHGAGNKVGRATPWLEMAAGGFVYLVAGGWVDDFLAEVTTFPRSKHDDMVDAVSVGVMALGMTKKKSKQVTQRAVNFYG